MKACQGKGSVCNQCKGRYCANKVSIFSILTEQHLVQITDGIYRKDYKKGDNIFFEGDIADKLYLINKGKVKILRYTKEGKEQIMYILAEGDFIGDLNLFKKGQQKFNAVALEDTNVCILTKEAFDEVLKNSPEIALKILQMMSEKVVSLEESIERLGINDVESRLVGLLLNMINDFGTPEGSTIVLKMPLSREDLANYIGTSRETVSRKLAALQSESLIELDGNKRIIIKDLAALELLK